MAGDRHGDRAAGGGPGGRTRTRRLTAVSTTLGVLCAAWVVHRCLRHPDLHSVLTDLGAALGFLACVVLTTTVPLLLAWRGSTAPSRHPLSISSPPEDRRICSPRD